MAFRCEVIQETEKLVHAILDYLQAEGQGQPLSVPSNLTFYSVVDKINYPSNQQGEFQAMVHPQLQ
jgi:aspartoacylase